MKIEAIPPTEPPELEVFTWGLIRRFQMTAEQLAQYMEPVDIPKEK